MAIYGIATQSVLESEKNRRRPGDLNGHLRDCDNPALTSDITWRSVPET